MIFFMPTRDEPRLTIRLGEGLDERLTGAALGVGVRKGTLVRRAIELGLELAVEEVRAVGGAGGNGDAPDRSPGRGAKLPVPPTGRVDASSAARGERRVMRAARAAVGAFRLDEVVAPVVGDMVRARRAINAGLVRVGGRVVRDPMARVDPALVEVES